jgi:iron uptake system component EfeO
MRTVPVPVLAIVLALPALAACSTSGGGSGAPGGEKVAVGVNDEGCTPSTMEVAAGTTVFAVTNNGSEAGEFEVLEGGQVLDEVENIVPGVTQDMSIDLEAGTYELICYLDDSPRGTLTVTEAAAS